MVRRLQKTTLLLSFYSFCASTSTQTSTNKSWCINQGIPSSWKTIINILTLGNEPSKRNLYQQFLPACHFCISGGRKKLYCSIGGRKGGSWLFLPAYEWMGAIIIAITLQLQLTVTLICFMYSTHDDVRNLKGHRLSYAQKPMHTGCFSNYIQSAL